MEQEDYFKRQIDQIGRVLGRIFSDLLGIKNKGEINEGIEITKQSLINELDIDIEELISAPTNSFIHKLKTEKNLSGANLDQLAEILLLMAGSNQNSAEKNEKIYEKCLTIYEYLEKTETTYSYDRHLKIDQLKSRAQF